MQAQIARGSSSSLTSVFRLAPTLVANVQLASAACDLSLSETRPAVTAQVASSFENGSAAICAVAAVNPTVEAAL